MPASLTEANACVVILSQQALGSLRMRNQARWFAQACERDASKKLWVIWREPLPPERVWSFLQPFPLISGSTPATFAPEHSIALTLQTLGVTPEIIASASKTVLIPPPTISVPPAPRRGRRRVAVVLLVLMASVVAVGGALRFGTLTPTRRASSATNVVVPTSGLSGATQVPSPLPSVAASQTRLIPTATGAAVATPSPTSTALTSPPSPPVVLNAGFESPALGAGNYQYDPPGGSWTFMVSTPQGGSGISTNNSGFTSGNPDAPEGAQVGVLQMGGAITQNLAGFRGGTRYTLTFAAAQRAGVNAGGEDFTLYLDTSALGTVKPSGTAYSDFSFSFMTTAGAHTLKFVGLDTAGGDNTAFLDAVRLTD